MISGKGILYTVLTAASAAVLVGTILTKRKDAKNPNSVGWSFRNLLGSKSQSNTATSAPTVLESQSSVGNS
jgi:fructosamine-3-kinase